MPALSFAYKISSYQKLMRDNSEVFPLTKLEQQN